MGNLITNWAKKQKVGNGVAKAILLCLADAAFDAHNGFVSMTVQQIAEIIEYEKRAIIRNLKKLETDKIITPHRSRNANGTNNPNEYQINCPKEVFEPSDSKTPGNLVTLKHQAETQGDFKAPSNNENPPKIDQNESDLVTLSHLEPGALKSPSTVLKEEESLKEIERNNAGAGFEPFPQTKKLVDQKFREEVDETLWWIQQQKQLSRMNFPAEEWLDLLTRLESDDIPCKEVEGGFRDFYEWAESQDWVETVTPNLLLSQIEKFKKRDVIAEKKKRIQGRKQNDTTNPKYTGNGNKQGTQPPQTNSRSAESRWRKRDGL